MALQTTRTRAMWLGIVLGGGAAFLGQSQRYWHWPMSGEEASSIIIGTIAGAIFWGFLFRWLFGRAPNQ